MVISELESFVEKFKQLWHSGLTAHLDVDTHAGEAWVDLRLSLGPAPGPPYQPVPFNHKIYKKHESPSRKKRRARREAERLEAAGTEKSSNDNDKNKVKEVKLENTGKVAESLDNIVVSTNVSDEFCPEELSLNRCSEDFIENVMVVSDKNFDGNENTAKEEIKKRLSSFGIEVHKVESFVMDEGIVKANVKVKPVEKTKLEEVMFPLLVSGWKIEPS